MDKVELKELDRAMLKRWEAGELEKELKRDYPKIKTRVTCYRALGVVTGTVNEGNKAVDWAKFEEVDPPNQRNRGGTATYKPHTSPDASRDASMIQAPYKPPMLAPYKPDTSIGLAPGELEALREVVSWWRNRKEDGGVQNTGTKKTFSYKLDTGLVEALERRAAQDGVPVVEALRRALAAYLGGAGGP